MQISGVQRSGPSDRAIHRSRACEGLQGCRTDLEIGTLKIQDLACSTHSVWNMLALIMRLFTQAPHC